MIGNSQKLSVDSGGMAIQAARDVNIKNGLSVFEVKELVATFLDLNMPKLRADAAETARLETEKFANKVYEEISKKIDTVALEKLAEPDVQATLVDAVVASGRKGDASHTDLLSKLICERLLNDSNPFKDVVISEAVKVIPMLTKEQISFITIVHLVGGMSINKPPSLASLDRFGRIGNNFIGNASGLSATQKLHIQYTGACSILDIVGGDIFGRVMAAYPEFGISNVEKFKESMKWSAPSYSSLLQKYQDEQMYTVTLTSVGQAIALVNLSRYMPDLDLSVWLK